MGWRYDYGDLEVESHGEKWRERWCRRKKLLVNTVNTVFDFGFIDKTSIRLLGLSGGTKCDAFAELPYYSRVIGDFQDKIQENLKAGKCTMDLKALPFATEGASNDSRDFFWDLDESLRAVASGTEAQGGYEKGLTPSRAFSGRAVPRATREASRSARWRGARAGRELAALARLSPSNVVKSEGRGWEPPRASVAALGSDVRFAACMDGGMAGVGI